LYIVVVGVNHRTAPVEVREVLSFSGRQAAEQLAVLTGMPSLTEAVILSTCNRTEVYAVTGDLGQGLASVREFLCRRSGVDLCTLRNHTYSHTLYEAIRHLFRVVCGLDSQLLGETQVLGQVRDAYQAAAEAGTCGVVFHTLFQKALAVGKRVRSETGIDQKAVSVSYAAVELARGHFGDLAGRTVLVVGAGKMSSLSARYLVENGVRGVIVSNRSYDRAVRLAAECHGRAVRFDELYRCLAVADIVISCTAATHHVIRAADLAPVLAGRERDMLMVDLAVPRDIEPAVAQLPGVTLYDIDDVKDVVDQNLAERRARAVQAEAIVEEELNIFMRWHGSLFVVPTIAALKRRGESIGEEELQKALNRLGPLSDHDRKVVTALARGVVNRLLHEPVTRLREYALTPQGHLYAEILQNLFNLGESKREPKEESGKETFFCTSS